MRRTKSCWTAVDLLSSRHFFRSRSRLRSSRSLSRRPHSEPQVRSDSRSQFRRYQQQKLRRTKSCWTAVGLLSSRCFFRSRRARPPLPPVCHVLDLCGGGEPLHGSLQFDAPVRESAWMARPPLPPFPHHPLGGGYRRHGWLRVGARAAARSSARCLRRNPQTSENRSAFCPGSSFPFFLHRIHGGLSRPGFKWARLSFRRRRGREDTITGLQITNRGLLGDPVRPRAY